LEAGEGHELVAFRRFLSWLTGDWKSTVIFYFSLHHRSRFAFSSRAAPQVPAFRVGLSFEFLIPNSPAP
jgi:hypothetical protein